MIYGGVAPSAVGSQKENALQRAKIFAFGRKENELLTLAFEHSRQLSDIELRLSIWHDMEISWDYEYGTMNMGL